MHKVPDMVAKNSLAINAYGVSQKGGRKKKHAKIRTGYGYILIPFLFTKYIYHIICL